jgi:hypothetical protein
VVSGECPASRPCGFRPGETALSTRSRGGCVDAEPYLDAVETRPLALPGIEPRFHGRPARDRSLRWEGISICSESRVKLNRFLSELARAVHIDVRRSGRLPRRSASVCSFALATEAFLQS